VLLESRRHRYHRTRELYQGAITRFEAPGVNAIGIPLDQNGMRMDALASELAVLKGRGVRPKYIYTNPDRAEPDRHHHAGTTPSRTPENCRNNFGVPIFRRRLLRRSGLAGNAATGIYAMSLSRNVIHIGSFLEINRAGPCGRLHRCGLGHFSRAFSP